MAEASAAVAERAVAAARDAFDTGPWPALDPVQRRDVLHRMVDLMTQDLDAMTTAMVSELGQPAPASRGALTYALSLWRRYADLAANYSYVQDRPVDDRRKARVIREPAGVVLAVTPWNSPFLLSTLKIAPALAAGCTVVVKPATEGPLTFPFLARAAVAAGLPAGVLNILCAGPDVTQRMVGDPRIDMVTFTGSTVVGAKVMAAAAPNITHVALELGGKSAAIVLEDADPTTVVPQLIAASGMGLAGQVCTSRSRILVPRPRAAEWTAALVTALDALRLGDPREPGIDQGPLATRAQRERVEGYVATGIAEGAVVARGGGRPDHLRRGWYFEPTLFTGVTSSMRIAQEEIFGPVLCLLEYDTVDEAVAIANDSEYGLAGSVFSPDVDRAYDVARRIRTGTFQINTTGRAIDQPFGGYKKSGLGREGGIEGLEAFLETKQIQMPIDAVLPV